MTAALYTTVWLALALFVTAEVGRTRFASAAGPAAWAWPAMIAGACLVAAHVLIALDVQYAWNHERAVRETARQAAAVYGFEWRGNIYVSYGFVLLWFAEAWRWRGRPTHIAPRSGAAVWAWRTFFFVVMTNGAVVFATTPFSRVCGALLVGVLVWAWWPAPDAHAQDRTQPAIR